MIRKILSILLLALVALPASQAGEYRRLVLVASAASSIDVKASGDIRRLYLGVPMIQQERAVRPLRNEYDAVLQEVFLQKVLYMSLHVYERQVLERVYRRGGVRPASYRDMPQLIEAIRGDPMALTYSWEEDVRGVPGVKVVGVLWEGSV